VSRIAIFVIPVAILLAVLYTSSESTDLSLEEERSLAELSSAISEIQSESDSLQIDRASTEEPSPATATFWSYYGLDHSVPHFMGTVGSPVASLMTHVYLGDRSRGTVFFVHGYYDHVGIHGRTLSALIEAGYTVVAFDLPGHGLSGGARVSIDDFSQYAIALESVLNAVREEVPKPYFFLGHSTGCSVAIEWLRTRGPEPFDRFVFVAPLVRSAYWSLSQIGNAMAGWFTDEVARQPRRDSGDPAFLRFRRLLDPLQESHFPLRWYRSLREWNERLETASFPAIPLLVIQGENDDIVAWKYNLAWFANSFPGCQVERIAGGDHQLLNDLEAIRERALKSALKSLGSSN